MPAEPKDAWKFQADQALEGLKALLESSGDQIAAEAKQSAERIEAILLDVAGGQIEWGKAANLLLLEEQTLRVHVAAEAIAGRNKLVDALFNGLSHAATNLAAAAIL